MLSSVHTLLNSSVDYAGLFPPAQLSLCQSMANYAQYGSSPDCWLLGRFVLPASRLDELRPLLSEFSLSRWPVSVIVGQDIEEAIAQIQSCVSHPQIVVESLEFPPLDPGTIAHLLPLFTTQIESFFEVPWSALDDYLPVLQSTQSAAKFRTGGITADTFPSNVHLAQAILGCAERRIPFKATAGLHHPLPAVYPLSYELDSATTMMHGFLNVALLAAIAFHEPVSLEEALVVLAVKEEKHNADNAFQFFAEHITWGDRTLSLTDIKMARRHSFRSFGSCSFEEPVMDLRALQLIE